MTLVQMQYFSAVCQYENFTKASEALHISQPAISAAMKDLERECGVPLFIRDKNSLRITDEGQVLLGEVSLIMEQYEHLNHIVSDLSLSRKYIRVGLSTLSGNQVYPELLHRYKEKYPEIQVMSVEESTRQQFEMLDKGLLDVIITIKPREQEMDDRAFDAEYGHWPMKRARQVFCVGLENPLAQKTEVTWQEIASQPLVLLNDHFNQSKRIREDLEKRGLPYHVLHYTNQMYTVERFVEKNVAGGFLPLSVAQQNPGIAGLNIEEENSFVSLIELFWKKKHFLFSATREFIDTAKELYPVIQ